MADLKRAWMPMMKTPPREEGVGHPDGHLGDACVSEQEAAQHGPREAVEVGENHNRRGHRMGMPNSRWRDECAARAEEARLEDHGRRGHEEREKNKNQTEGAAAPAGPRWGKPGDRRGGGASIERWDTLGVREEEAPVELGWVPTRVGAHHGLSPIAVGFEKRRSSSPPTATA